MRNARPACWVRLRGRILHPRGRPPISVNMLPGSHIPRKSSSLLRAVCCKYGIPDRRNRSVRPPDGITRWRGVSRRERGRRWMPSNGGVPTWLPWKLCPRPPWRRRPWLSRREPSWRLGGAPLQPAALIAFLTAAMTLRCTERGLPGMRAPAAAGWPPPPNCAAMVLTFTFSLFERRLMRVNSGSNFLEYARDHHRGDGADVINQAFRIAAVGAGAGKVGFL